jgi:hypothetical protein
VTSIENAMAEQCKDRWGACHFLDWKTSHSGSKGALNCPRHKFQLLGMNNYKSLDKYGCEALWHLPSWLFDNDTQIPTHLNPYHDADLFVVVRNPYDRVVSEYYWRHTIEISGLPFRLLNKQTHMNDRMKNMLQPRLQYANTPDDAPDPWTMNDYFKKSGHWVPQYQYIFNPQNKQVVKHVLRMENLQEQFDNLMLEYNLNIALPHVMKSKKSSNQQHIHRWTSHDLSLENQKLIETIYAQDFDPFDYPRFTQKQQQKGETMYSTTEIGKPLNGG